RGMTHITGFEREHAVASALRERVFGIDLREVAGVIGVRFDPAAEMCGVEGDGFAAVAVDETDGLPLDPFDRDGNVVLPPGALVVLCTAALVEGRDASRVTGLERLRAAAVDCASVPVGSVCDELLSRLTPHRGFTAHVAVVAVRAVRSNSESHVD